MEFIIAQVSGLIAEGLAVLAVQMKEKKKYLIIYAISYGFFVCNMLLLKAYSGAINCIILTVLTIISAKFENKKFPIKLIILFGILILVGNVITYINIFSLLPMIASYIYLIILVSKNMKNIRRLEVTSRILWGIYDFKVGAYTAFIIDIVILLSSLLAIYRIDIKKKDRNYKKV